LTSGWSGPGRRRIQPVKELGDPASVFARILEQTAHAGRTPTLARVDPRGSFELSSGEMDLLLDDLDRLVTGTAGPHQRRHVSELVGLARECAASAGTALIFYGD
jgi:hypothetical protein